MLHMWEDAAQFYNHTFENADPRVTDWPLMQSPWPTLVICLSYVYIVKFAGPSLMKNRQPLDIRWLMVIYNFGMVILSFLVFYWFGIYGWFTKYSWTCQPVDYSRSPEAMAMASVCWWFYVSKFIEFTDTIFFVMRKKYSQVSTLHVTHHGIMPMSIWWGLKFTPGGHSTFFAFINSFVHVLMYTYYGLAAIGPHMNKYLWWKKYMTTIQMVQFIIIFAHSFQLLFVDCNYPRGFMWWIGFHAVLFWFLFVDFYKNAYRKKKFICKKNADETSYARLNGKPEVSMNGCPVVQNGSATKAYDIEHVKINGHTGCTVHANGKEMHLNGFYMNGINGVKNVNHVDGAKDISSKKEL